MAFETPCLSEPSRNGAKSTTLTVELFCELSGSMEEETLKQPFGSRLSTGNAEKAYTSVIASNQT